MPADQDPNDTPGLLAELGCEYTGLNGYEDLLLAMQAVRDSDAWSQARDRFDELTLDELRALLSDAGIREALRLVRVGLSKPISTVRPVLDQETPFPEIGYARDLARLIAAEQRLLVEDGQTAEAADSLRVGLGLGREFQHDGLVAGLVGCIVTAIAAHSAARHLPRFTAGDCATVAATCREWLSEPDGLANVIEREHAGALRTLERMLVQRDLDPASVMVLDFPDVPELDTPELAELTAEMRRRAAAVEQARHDAERAAMLRDGDARIIDAAFARFRRLCPRSHWERAPSELMCSLARATDGDEPLAVEIADAIIGPLESAFGAYAQQEAFVRLLTTEALLHRWQRQQRAFPADLATLAVGDLVIDPFMGRPFNYELATNDFDLYSAGRNPRRPLRLAR